MSSTAMSERFLVTGATGCIGAWAVRNLVRQGMPAFALVRSGDMHRLKLIMSEKELSAVEFIKADIVDLGVIERVISENKISHIIHLAAMQLPFCKDDPPLAAAVNVQGTVNIFEAAARHGIRSVVYASSTAVYGLAEEYPSGPLMHDAPLKPRSHYGVYKQANEGTARVYWLDNGISSIGIRPYVVYGPGRDQGMTSSPTKAMLAAALGKPYKISYGGRFGFQYADDTANAYINAARVEFKGAEVFNLGGETVGMEDVIKAIEAAEPSSRGSITYEDKPLPFPEEIDNKPLIKVLGKLSITPLAQGVAESIRTFKKGIAEGNITAEQLN